eukprot:CAMPEP_0197180322 /NCGR_PEP_ID=MMETSP1423-20130617/4972_1 /TAXON_ID=476441 /ORGANISM="Pseudo-nitzschia heimii, Strain UNC1101" /LENGTH=848 /DNA_ID=CAMNT_0042630383 /DNA_START=219 /DNA_END=2765 /DNA_ORIENTATION=+
MTFVISNADTIMDLAATPKRTTATTSTMSGHPSRLPPSSSSSSSSPSRVIYKMNEETEDEQRNTIVYTMSRGEPDHHNHQTEVDRIVSDHIVSAVKKGLRRSKHKQKKSSNSNSKIHGNNNGGASSPSSQTDPRQQRQTNGSRATKDRRNGRDHDAGLSSTNKGRILPPKPRSTTSSSAAALLSYKPKPQSSRGDVEVVPVVVSDDGGESIGRSSSSSSCSSSSSSRHRTPSRYSTAERSEWSSSKSSRGGGSESAAGFQGFLNGMMYSKEDRTVDDSMVSTSVDDVDCEYNYIDDESYGNTTCDQDDDDDDDGYSSRSSGSTNASSEDFSSGSSMVEDRRRTRRGRRQRHRHHRRSDDNDDDDDDDGTKNSHGVDARAVDAKDRGGAVDDDDADEAAAEAFWYPPAASAPRGLDIVARLLAGATELSLDASSIMTASAEEHYGKPTASGGSSSTNNKKRQTPVHEIARHVSDALAQTTSLQRISFCGPWKGRSFRERLVLEILFDGLLDNTSIHTVVVRDNPVFDRYAGYAFGTMLKSHPRLSKLEILHCRFVASGWNSLFTGMQHSSSVKTLWVDDCPGLSGDHIDAISSTIRYLQLKCLRLSGVKLHKIDTENLSFLLRSVQQTKTLREVDLSKNDLGGAPLAILLLSKCLSGDPVWIGNGNGNDDDGNNIINERNHLPINYHHHIEKLVLVDCGISRKSSIRTLVKALDSTQAKLDASNNEHPLVLHTLDVSKNAFGDGGARVLQKLVDTNPKITTLGMVGCGASALSLKTMADRLRYNNSFLQTIGLSSEVSLAILDSVSAVEHVFGKGGGAGGSKANGVNAGLTMVVEDDESVIDAPRGCCG